MILAVPGNLW
jgi:energy-coupling factor transporter ATP-binding protein EcfA2